MSEYDVLINKYDALNNNYDQLYPKPMKHANTHANGGTDPITPGVIGAYSKNETDTLLSTKPNPWLNDNGVFLPGCLVDQRQGYVVPKGVRYWQVTSGYPEIGITESYYTVAQIDNVGNPHFYIDGVEYFVNHNLVSPAYVRGYTGAGYGIDRWKLNGVDNGVPVYLVDTHELINESASGYVQTVQIIPYDFAKNLVGKTVTMSVLFDDGFSGETFFELQEFNTWTRIAFQSVTAVNQVVSVTFTMPSISNNIQFYVGTRGRCRPIAVKLELGDTQTLAHQDSSGSWVLNELPNYADTLARCQMHQVLYGNLKSDEAFAPLGAGYSYNDNTIFVMLDLPQELCKSATKEVEIIGSLANFGLYYNQAEYVVPSAVSIDQVGTRYIGLKFTVPSTPASSYVLKPRTTGTGLLIKANL